MVSGADEAGSGTESPSTTVPLRPLPTAYKNLTARDRACLASQGGCRWVRAEQPMASVYPQPVSLPQHICGQSGTVGRAEAG